jgi:Fe-S-cluster containining protein
VTKRLSIRSPARRQESTSAADLQARAEREAQRQRVDAFLASRDAGDSLTSDALANGADVPAAVAVAESVADYTDRALAIVAEEYRPALQCREGCAYCCCKPGVLVTVPELLRILATVAAHFDAEAQAQLAARAERYVTQLGGRHFNDATDESVPCPLLVDSRCSVYEVRPLVCRGYNSTSVAACRAAHEDARQLIPIF